MAYTLEDLDNALANSIGPAMWEAVGPSSGASFCRPIVMNRAATERWYRQMPEDDDARIIREAFRDLSVDGCLKPSDGWDGDQGEKQSWE